MNREIILIVSIIFIILLGIVSRVFKLNNEIWDHYLGDALYAIMFYLILSLLWPSGEIVWKFIIISIVMLGFEFFQLTGIPQLLMDSGNSILKIIAILLGTKFSWLEIIAYFAGIFLVIVIEFFSQSKLR